MYNSFPFKVQDKYMPQGVAIQHEGTATIVFSYAN